MRQQRGDGRSPSPHNINRIRMSVCLSVCLSVCHRTTSQRKEMTTRKWYRSKRAREGGGGGVREGAGVASGALSGVAIVDTLKVQV